MKLHPLFVDPSIFEATQEKTQFAGLKNLWRCVCARVENGSIFVVLLLYVWFISQSDAYETPAIGSAGRWLFIVAPPLWWFQSKACQMRRILQLHWADKRHSDFICSFQYRPDCLLPWEPTNLLAAFWLGKYMFGQCLLDLYFKVLLLAFRTLKFISLFSRK